MHGYAGIGSRRQPASVEEELRHHQEQQEQRSALDASVIGRTRLAASLPSRPGEDRLGRLVFVVSRQQPERYDFLKRAFSDEETVEIVLDRRRGQRRRQSVASDTERRRSDRRTMDRNGEIDRLGWTLIRR
jgi:hypothetical protein